MISEIAGIVFVSLLFWYVLDYWNHRRRPPGPTRFPILGNLVQLALADRVSNIALHKISKVYGDLVTLKMGTVDVLLIASHKIYVDMYSRNDTLERPVEGWLKDRILSQDIGIAFSSQKPWEIIRRFSAKSLHKFGFANRNSMEKFITQELESFIEYTENKIRTSQIGTGIIHFHRYFDTTLINLMSHFLLGKRYSYEDKDLQRIVHCTEKLVQASVFGTGLMTAYPFLRFIFPNALGYNIQMECTTEIHNFARHHLRRQLNLERGATESNYECFLADYVQKMKEEKDNPESIFTEDQFVACFADLIQAGSETTSSYLEFSILLLITHPEVQEKLYQEILAVIGERGRPSMTDYIRMDYTRAVIMEIHRFGKIIISVVPRKVTQDFTYRNYLIKKGTMLLANQYSMYGDYDSNGVERFRPERFLTEDGKFMSSLAENIAPFGAGKRNCFGESLATDSIFLYLTTLVQKFSFKIPDGENFPDLKSVIGLSSHPRPFNAKVECRF